MSRMRLALAAALLAGACVAYAQQLPAEPPARGRGGPGFGLSIDLGSLFRGLSQVLTPRPNDPETAPAHAAGQIVVAWDADLGVDARTLAGAAGAAVLAQEPLAALGLRIALLGVEDARVEAALDALRTGFPDVVSDRHALVYPQQAASASAALGRLYAAALIGVEAPRHLKRPVRIGLIDGDVEPAVGLAATLQIRRFAPKGDDGRHATAVVCLLTCWPRGGDGRRFYGLVQGADLRIASVLGSANDGRAHSDTFTLARALDWLVAEGTEIVNISLGSAGDAVLERVVARTLPRLAALVAAAGNGGLHAPPAYPAAYPGVIAVAAVDAEAQPWRQGARGSYIAIAAPGVDVWVPDGDGRYATGTSFAAPFVTAALAWQRAQGGEAGIKALCRAARDLPPAGRDDASGCGLMQWPREKD